MAVIDRWPNLEELLQGNSMPKLTHNRTERVDRSATVKKVKDLPPCGCCKRSGFWLGDDGHTYGSDGQEHSSYKEQAQSIGFDR